MLKKIITVLLILCCICLCGCSVQNTKIDESKFNIVTSFYPIYVATSNIVDGIEDVTLDNMTDVQVGCLHDYQLSTKDMNKLEKSDVFIINGGGMESFLDKVMSASSDLKIINSSEGILENDEDEHHEEHGLHHEHNHSEEENAHIWVSINLYIKQVQNIANELAKVDTKNAEKYLTNAENYITKLQVLNQEMHSELQNLENKNIVTFHEAFEYFADEYGLNIVAVIENEPGTSPSAGQVAQIIEKIKETSAVAIFVEPQYEKTAANVISKETGIPVYTLDPVVSGNLEKGEYERIMKENLEVLKEALKNEK